LIEQVAVPPVMCRRPHPSKGEGAMTDTLEKTETHRLIASDKVEGTAVYSPQNDKLGTISNVMIDKKSGKSEYAIVASCQCIDGPKETWRRKLILLSDSEIEWNGAKYQKCKPLP
jgi:hypothetical protein